MTYAEKKREKVELVYTICGVFSRLVHPTSSRFGLVLCHSQSLSHSPQQMLYAVLFILTAYLVCIACSPRYTEYCICAVGLCFNSLALLLLLSLQPHCYVSTLRRTLCPQQRIFSCHFSSSTLLHTLYQSSCEGPKSDSCSKHYLTQKNWDSHHF